MAALIYIPTNSVGGFPLLHILSNIYYLYRCGLCLVMYRCESWTKKKAEDQRIDAFELWC